MHACTQEVTHIQNVPVSAEREGSRREGETERQGEAEFAGISTYLNFRGLPSTERSWNLQTTKRDAFDRFILTEESTSC